MTMARSDSSPPRTGWHLLIVLVTTFLLGCSEPKPTGYAFTRQVIRVIDGDSLYIKGINTQIRLFGVDAPERDETGYVDATQALKQITKKQHIKCAHVEDDNYGRHIARCFLADGQEGNALMIASGTAREYCRFSKGRYGNC